MNGSFLRNENLFPDSGHLNAALHEAVPDPKETLILNLTVIVIGRVCGAF